MQEYRYRNYHSSKRQLVGQQPGVAAPAWKPNQQARRASGPPPATGSKILLSMLPSDVGQEEVDALFAKTVGPVKDAFIVYNNQGNSKGMAVVWFNRVGDAAIARAKYNGKIIDGRRPIKIEIIVDEDEVPKTAPPPAVMPSLLQRLSPAARPVAPVPAPAPVPIPQHPRKAAQSTRAAAAANPRIPKRQKKGPKRLKKVALTAAQLDAEMDKYRANRA